MESTGSKNNERSYKNLGRLMNKARMAGMIDWNLLEDRTRYLRGYTTFDDPSDALDWCAERYKTDLWKDQSFRVEVWVEKDALVGVVGRAANPYRVDYFSCRGYTSASETWNAAMRMQRRVRYEDQTPVILHLGDHDPSGCDMSRDIEERIRVFMGEEGDELIFRRIALNMDQIRHYNPPPSPAKITDSRSSGYIDQFGDDSWELDALDPNDMTSLIRERIKDYLSELAFAAAHEAEREDREKIRRAAQRWRDDD